MRKQTEQAYLKCMRKQLNKHEKLQNLANQWKKRKWRKKMKVLSVITSGQNKQNLFYHFKGKIRLLTNWKKGKIRLLTNWHSSSTLPGSIVHGNINFMAFIYLSGYMVRTESCPYQGHKNIYIIFFYF